MQIQSNETTYGRAAEDRRADALQPSLEGARASLETFYHAFNQRSMEVFDSVWASHHLIQLNNPLGGIVRGIAEIRALYQRIFDGPARVWVEFHDIVEFASDNTVIFAGRERGEFAKAGRLIPLEIRTSRVYQYFGPTDGWLQVHHHGSIDDVQALQTYQQAVQG